VEAVVVDAGPFTLEVFLGGYRESCQYDLHVLGSLFLFGGIFRGSWRQVGIMDHLFGGVCCLLSVLRLLCHLGGDVRCGKSFSWAFLAFICLLGGRVSLGALRVQGADGRRVVHILCSPKGKGGLNPSLVEGLVPHLEAIESAHLRDLSLESFLGLCHAHVIVVLLSLLLGLLGLLQLLCQDFDMALGSEELVLGLAKLFALSLHLPLHPIQSGLDTFLVSINFH